MASFKVTKTLYYSGKTVRTSKTYTEDEVVSLSTTVAGSKTDQHHILELDVSRIKALFVMADGGDLLMETNNAASGARDDYLDLIDGVPYTWSSDEANDPSNLIGTDIDNLYLTNAGSDTVTFEFFALIDSTPE